MYFRNRAPAFLILLGSSTLRFPRFNIVSFAVFVYQIISYFLSQNFYQLNIVLYFNPNHHSNRYQASVNGILISDKIIFSFNIIFDDFNFSINIRLFIIQ